MDSLDYDQTEAESEQVQEIMAALTASEIESLPDAYMVLRHLRAEKGKVSDAIDATKRTLSWQKEFGVKDIKTCIGHNEELESILRKENETGKLYVRGHDKDGRAILYMRSAKENTNHETNNMRHLVYHMEKAVACSAAKGRSKICIIVDYTGFHMKHIPPLSTTRYTLDILQKHYPERLHRAYICNPPYVFRGFWKVVSPFVDPVTKQKVCFCTGRNPYDEIIQDMGGSEKAAQHLEPCAGGPNPALVEFDSVAYLDLPMDVTFGESS